MTPIRILGAAAAALLLALPAGSALAQGATPPAPSEAPAGHSGHAGMAGHTGTAGDMSPASTAYMDAMTAMDEAMAGMTMTGRPGADFAAMMIPHHQSAIDMAEAYLASGDGDPVLTRMAEDIVASQAGEIAAFETWLKENGAR